MENITIVKLKTDGTPKNTVCNKRKGVKSEVYPFQPQDIGKMIGYFQENGYWNHYLVFIFGCNMARRISDTLKLRWVDLYNPQTGCIRKDANVVEKKTDKLANPHINSVCRSAIALYLEKTGIDPAENSYQNYVFAQTSGNYAGRILSASCHIKVLKAAASAVGIEYNVGTHSERKTFGMISKMIHPNDPNAMELLQKIFNHSSAAITANYIGLTKEKTDQYYDDMANFFDRYVFGDEEYVPQKDTPIVSIENVDLRSIIQEAYELGMKNADVADISKHIATINSIMSRVDKCSK